MLYVQKSGYDFHEPRLWNYILNTENTIITILSDYIDGDKFIEDYPGWDFQMQLFVILMGWSFLKRKCMSILLGQKRLAVLR